MSRPRALALVPVLVLLAGCGGASKATAPARSPAPPPAPIQSSPAGGYGAASAPASKPTPGRGAPPSDKSAEDRDLALPTLDGALSEFKQAAARLSASGNDCGTACRALGSMRRAEKRICELEPQGPAARCERARERLRDAERRVRAGCGAC